MLKELRCEPKRSLKPEMYSKYLKVFDVQFGLMIGYPEENKGHKWKCTGFYLNILLMLLYLLLTLAMLQNLGHIVFPKLGQLL